MIIAVIILVISVIKDTIITILEDLVVIRVEVVTSEVVIATSEVVIAITEIVTVEVDIQIAIHVPVHIQALVEDLATNAITLVDGKFIFFYFFSIESLFFSIFNSLLTKLQLFVYTFITGGEMELTAPILGKHLHLPPLQIIMAVVLLTLVMPKIF